MSNEQLHTGLKALALSQQTNEQAYREAMLAEGAYENLLERFPAPKTSATTLRVQLDCPEFTSLCPLTSQPDFGHIKIEYLPGEWMVESKSLKLYLFTFRQRGHFHEACVNEIGEALFKLLEPKWIKVHGDFMPRGGISINPTYENAARVR